jgi:hypothetical protein
MDRKTGWHWRNGLIQAWLACGADEAWRERLTGMQGVDRVIGPMPGDRAILVPRFAAP